MNTEAIAALAVHDEVPATAWVARDPSTSAGVSFSQRIVDGLQQVNEQLVASQSDLQKLALGETQSLHEVMVRLEESRVSFQLMMQVRNRVLEAYQDVMRMQV